MIARSAIIVGGGVAGLTAANALLQKGFQDVRVLERAPPFKQLPRAGAGYVISPNGQIVLEHLGFKDRLAKILHPFKTWTVLKPNGETLSSESIFKEFEEKYDLRVGGVLRSRLIYLLLEELHEKGIMYFDCDVAKLEENPDYVTVQLQNGETFKADVVIGADGINSVVANSFSDESQPRFSGYNMFYGIISADAIEESQHQFLGRHSDFVQLFDNGEFYSYFTGGALEKDPYGDVGALVWACSYVDESFSDRPELYDWRPIFWAASDPRLRVLLKKFNPRHPIHHAVALTQLDNLIHFNLYDRDHRSTWHTNRICLIGDGCHAMLPCIQQGANQSLEDGLALAQCLQEAQWKIPDGLKSFTQLRQTRINDIVDTARQLASVWHSESKVSQKFRESLFKRLLDRKWYLRLGKTEYVDKCSVRPEPEPKRVSFQKA